MRVCIVVLCLLGKSVCVGVRVVGTGRFGVLRVFWLRRRRGSERMSTYGGSSEKGLSGSSVE